MIKVVLWLMTLLWLWCPYDFTSFCWVNVKITKGKYTRLNWNKMSRCYIFIFCYQHLLFFNIVTVLTLQLYERMAAHTHTHRDSHTYTHTHSQPHDNPIRCRVILKLFYSWHHAADISVMDRTSPPFILLFPLRQHNKQRKFSSRPVELHVLSSVSNQPYIQYQ